MDKFVKICEIMTDSEEETRKILNILKDTVYSICVIGDWGTGGSNFYVIEYRGEMK